jgi:hypothetical protein
MKKFITIILFVGVLLQSLNKLVVIVNFELRKDYIAKNLCENRDKPKLCCKGKCQLKKALNKTENDNPKSKTNQSFSFDEYMPVYSDAHIKPHFIVLSDIPKQSFIPQEYCFDPLRSIFHPPQV